MTEGLGLAGMSETPLVVIIASRPGPATGLPTWTEQSDLNLAINAAQGEFPRFVVAPGDAEEMFYAVFNAHNLAEKYQTPVIILSDKYLAESNVSIKPFDLEKLKINRGKLLSEAEYKKLKRYSRYTVTDSGVSPRALPHYKGHVFLQNSDEHDEFGYTNERSVNRVKQQEKRWRKFRSMKKEIPAPVLYGSRSAKLTILGWGSTQGPILDALEQLSGEVNFYHFSYLWPFPEQAVRDIFKKSRKVLIAENNTNGQLASLITQNTGITKYHKLNKFDGRPFFTEEIAQKAKELLS
jgi:2-oxoglutarate/2-oxoacid ferredoxin oxidoreductase subunit alpha